MKLHFLYFEAHKAWNIELLRSNLGYTQTQAEAYLRRRWGHRDMAKNIDCEYASWRNMLKELADSVVVSITVPDQEEIFMENITRMNIVQYMIYHDNVGAVNQNYPEQGRRLFTRIFKFPVDYKGVDHAVV
jgi:hypothetical protein